MIYVLVALESEVGDVCLSADMQFVFTGVGKINATYHATRTVLQPDCAAIINYGTAGTLQPALAGQFVRVGQLVQRDMDGRPLVERGITPFEAGEHAGTITVADGGVSLSTGDNFVTSPPAIVTDIVDMEAYAIAKICARHKVPFSCYKFITDLADENATESWRDNVSKGAALFQSQVVDAQSPR